MGLMDDQDTIGKKIHEQRDIEKLKNEVADKAKEEAAKEQQQHEENKQQGMI